MAKSIIKRIVSLVPFCLVGLFILGLIFTTATIIFKNISKESLFETLSDPYIFYIIRSNLWQAFISSFLTIILAIPIARALHRRSKFFGRSLMINFINLSFALPSIALALGIILIHGKNGWVNSFMTFVFGTSFHHYLYGIFGVATAHIAFCLPLAVRTFLNCFETIPQETWKISTQLNLSSWNLFKYIEWPSIRATITSIYILIFIMCFISFAIVLNLGGGPKITTLEVSIYQAIKIDFNLPLATILSLIQLIICISLMLVTQKLNSQIFLYTTSSFKHYTRPDSKCLKAKTTDIFFLISLFAISILPVIAIIESSFSSKLIDLLHSSKFFGCLKQSILISLLSSIIALVMALSLNSGAFYLHHHLNRPKLAEKIIFLGNVRMMIPMFIFITGLFLTINNFNFVMNHAFFLLSVINAMAALPFIVNILWADSLNFAQAEINLCKQLNINYWNFIKLIYFPRIRKNLGYAFSFAMAISWGDLGLIALFSSKDLNTLPHLLYTMLSSYRIEEAICISFIIILLSFFFFWIVDELWSGDQNVRT